MKKVLLSLLISTCVVSMIGCTADQKTNEINTSTEITKDEFIKEKSEQAPQEKEIENKDSQLVVGEVVVISTPRGNYEITIDNAFKSDYQEDYCQGEDKIAYTVEFTCNNISFNGIDGDGGDANAISPHGLIKVIDDNNYTINSTNVWYGSDADMSPFDIYIGNKQKCREIFLLNKDTKTIEVDINRNGESYGRVKFQIGQ